MILLSSAAVVVVLVLIIVLVRRATKNESAALKAGEVLFKAQSEYLKNLDKLKDLLG